MKIRHLIFFFLNFISVTVFAADPFDEVRNEILKGNKDKAIVLLKTGIEKNTFSADDKAVAFFALGTLNYQVGRLSESANYFQNALKAGTRLIEYAHLYLGRFYKQEGKFSEAHQHLRQVRLPWSSKKNFLEARFEMGLLAILEKEWNQARMHFDYLSHRMKGSEYYPQILWNLTLAESKLKRSWQACRWARKLYTKYPTHPLVYNWGIDLHSAKVDGDSLGCYATASDVESRIQRLQWLGESDRARQEIEGLRDKVSGANEYHVDMMMAEYMVNEGYVDEALNLLLKHFEKRKTQTKYLMLLGKAATRAQKFTLAVSSYYRVYQLTPKSRTGRTALFRAASLSYQFQDYDGAGRKFDLIVDKFPRSGLVRDAYWHLAWIKYLKGNYSSAYESLTSMMFQKKRSKGYWRSLSPERVNYWRAMCLLKMEKKIEARRIFEGLAKDSGHGYYSILAKNRLQGLPQGEMDLRLPAAQTDLTNADVPPANPDLAVTPVTPEEAEDATVSEEEESEETVNTEAAEGEIDEEEPDVAVAAEPETSEENKEMILPMTFGSPDFIRKYQRAQDLVRLGFYEWARWELYEIEGKVRNAKNLRMLIAQYQALESFNRATTVAHFALSQERRKKGVEAPKDLWQATYPQAYVSAVKSSASEFSVPPHFVWSIIRAESLFKADAKSPTGAVGLMQIMPMTAKQVARMLKDDKFVLEKLLDPSSNIRLGTRYLARLLKKFSNQIPLVAAGYNAGPHRVDSWLTTFGTLDMDEFVEHIPFVETRDYVRKVVSNLFIYDLVYNGKESAMKWMIEPVGVKGNLLSSFREIWDE